MGERWETRELDTDRTGGTLYAFNELGYRGPSFDASKRFLAFVFGESDAFGMGVEWDRSWAVQAAFAHAERLGVPRDDVMVMNFAESGASNAYIARQVALQCERCTPDLVIVGLAEHARTELLTEFGSMSCGTWLETAESEKAIEESPFGTGQRASLRRSLERGREFLGFVATEGSGGGDEQQIYETLRSLLWMQSTLVAAGIPAAIIGRDTERFFDERARHHPILSSMARSLRSELLLARSVSSLTGRVPGDDGVHLTDTAHAVVANAVTAHLAEPPQRWPWHGEVESKPSTNGRPVTRTVAEFYDELPFNYHGSLEGAEEAIRVGSVARHYLDLNRYLEDRDAPDVLEVGCGAGWLSHGLHLHHGATVRAVDLSSSAIERARELGRRLGTSDSVRFEQADVLEYERPERYDLAISIGALHHTADPRAALGVMARHLRPKGHVYLGLYHLHGRRVFLDEMRRIVREEGEDAAFEAYCALDTVHASDETLARSWFRDQVLHPHETQHTLEEVVGWFDELDVELTSTSINGFYPIESLPSLFKKERKLDRVAKRVLFKEKRYYPGFFTAFGQLRH